MATDPKPKAKPQKKDKDGLTVTHRRFLEEYMVDLSISRAAQACKINVKTGWKIVQTIAAQAFIQREIDKRSERCSVKADDVMKELCRLGFSNMLDYVKPDADGMLRVDMSAITRAQAAAIGEVKIIEKTGQSGGSMERTVTFKLADKRGALVDIGKHLQMFQQPAAGDKPGVGAGSLLRELTGDELDAAIDNAILERGLRDRATPSGARTATDKRKLQ